MVAIEDGNGPGESEQVVLTPLIRMVLMKAKISLLAGIFRPPEA